MGKILIIENDNKLSKLIDAVLRELGHDISKKPSFFNLKLQGHEIFAEFRKYQSDLLTFDLIVFDPTTDPNFENNEKSLSFLLLKDIASRKNMARVIIVTSGKLSTSTLEDYFKYKFDFMSYHPSIPLEDWKNNFENNVKRTLNEIPQEEYKHDNIIGSSYALKNCLFISFIAAKKDYPILITGETGTGKELLAKFIHENSQRKGGPLITLNCAAITESLAESELFGIEKDVASGVKPRIGKIQLAHLGTLFLDEIGDIPLSLQAKLLRVLQEKKFLKVGGSQEIKSDFRLISATNKNLEDMVKVYNFKDDLLYRINSVIVDLPSLRARKGDIEELTKYFLKEEGFNGTVHPDFFEAIRSYNWPGNIRELKSVIRRALIMRECNELAYEKIMKELADETGKVEFKNTKKWLNKDDLPDQISTAYSVMRRSEKEKIYNIISTMKTGGMGSIKEGEPDRNVTNDGQKTKDQPLESQLKSEGLLYPPSFKKNSDFSNNDKITNWKDYVSDCKKYYLESILKAANNDIKKAAKIYGITPSVLYGHLKKIGIPTKPN
jgi:transcriptional regulator with PAS, ATPase and Fis domain